MKPKTMQVLRKKQEGISVTLAQESTVHGRKSGVLDVKAACSLNTTEKRVSANTCVW